VDNEILNLQKRVAQLEAALAAMSQERCRHRFYRRAGLTMLVCAVIGAVAFAFTFSATAQGPSKVTAPFQVVDNHGKVLFSVSVTAAGNPVAGIMRDGQIKAGLGVSQVGDGLIRAFSASDKAEADLSGDIGLYLMNRDGHAIAAFGIDESTHAGTAFLSDEQGSRILELGRATASDKPDIQILRGGNLKLGIGTSKDNDGYMVLSGGKNKTNVVLQGTGLLQADNGSGKTVITLGVNGFGGGGLHLRNSSGTDVAGIFSEQGQTGIAQLFDNGGKVKLTLGTLTETRQGDVCAYGDKGSVCLRFIKPNY